MSTEKGVSTGVHIGPIYYEKTSHGDHNLGVSLGLAGGQGVVGGVEAYAEITYNKNDGLSAGYGTTASVGVGVNVGVPVKATSGGVYHTGYYSKDSRE